MSHLKYFTFCYLLLHMNPTWAWTDWFKNPAQQAETAYTEENYAEAAGLFTEPYQRGVALYRAKNYAAAAAAFAEVENPEQQLSALYNQGNSYFQQQNYVQAITQYEAVLDRSPDHADARYNLNLARQKLAEQQQNQQNNQHGESGDDEQAGENTQHNAQSGENQQTQQSQANEGSESDSENAQSQAAEAADPQDNPADNAQTAEQAAAEAEAQESAEQQAQAQDESAVEEDATATAAANDDAADTAASTDAAAAQLPSETDMRADALLNRLQSNQSDILRSQFYIDARRSQASKPEQTW